jgi:hypothetical protein
VYPLAVVGRFSARFVFALTPVPDSPTVSGLPGALDATDSVPLAAPAAAGAKTTLTVHEPPAAIELPQVLVWLNGPVTLTEETVAAALPDTVTVSRAGRPDRALPNDRLDGDAAGGELVPPPLAGTCS